MRRRRSKPQTEFVRGDWDPQNNDVRPKASLNNLGESVRKQICASRPTSPHNSAAIGDKTQKLRERRWGKTTWAALDVRDARRRTRTAKVLNSNSFIGTNNRFGFSNESVESFITFSKGFYFALNLCDGRCGLDCTRARFCIAPFEAVRLLSGIR